MNKRQAKTSASSARVAGGFGGFGVATTQTSTLSYVQPPPNYSALTDPSLTVLFKNLTKKDDVTKAKALEELSAHLDGQTTEQGAIQIWVQLFPRLSIDSSRRVRQLTQAVNGKICKSVGRELAQHMPRLVGPWLAAQYDNDKLVSRAAKEALILVFPDPAKLAALWDIFSSAILEFSKTSILQESVESLSDTRSVTADEAELVYARTISACLQLLASFLQNAKESKLSALTDELQQVLGDKVLSFAIFADAAVRRATHRLVLSAVGTVSAIIADRQKLVSNYYVYKALPSDQQGSRVDYLETLVGLSSQYPKIWTEYYSGKKAATARLCQFLEIGSQNGQTTYWQKCGQLFSALPDAAIQTTVEARHDLLAAARRGAGSRDDRIQNVAAWQFYIDLEQQLSTGLPDDQIRSMFSQEVTPIFSNFVQPNPESESWNIQGPQAALIFSRIKFNPSVLVEAEQAISASQSSLIDSIRASQPEQSQHFDQSQKQLIAQGSKYVQMLDALLSNQHASANLHQHILEEATQLVQTVFKILSDRNGKPYGAASVINKLVQLLQARSSTDNTLHEYLNQVAKSALPSLLYSPSAPRLIEIFEHAYSDTEFASLFDQLVLSILHTNHEAEDKLSSILGILPERCPTTILQALQKSVELQTLVKSTTQHAIAVQAISSGICGSETALAVIKSLDSDLTIEDQRLETLEQLDLIAHGDRKVLLTNHVQLLARILDLRDSHDQKVANLAISLSKRLSSINRSAVTAADATVVRHAIENTSLTVYGVLELAHTYLGDHISLEVLVSCIPTSINLGLDHNKINVAPDPSMSVCSPLVGATRLVVAGSQAQTPTDLVRTAVCMSGLLEKLETQGFDQNTMPQLCKLLLFCSAVLAMADDQLSMGQIQSGSLDQGEEIDQHNATSLSAISAVVQKLDPQSTAELLRNLPFAQPGDYSPLAYYTAVARSHWLVARDDQTTLLQTSLPEHGDVVHALQNMNVFDFAALLSSEPSASVKTGVLRISNNLVSKITGTDLSLSNQDTQQDLVALSLCLASDTDVVAGIAKQRVMFLIQHLLKTLSSPSVPAICELVLRILHSVLPAIADMYGEHWKDTLSGITKTWSSSSTAADLPCLFVSVRLYNKLDQMSQGEDPNEDLVEALQEYAGAVSAGLLQLLSGVGELPLMNRPLDNFCALLSRTVSSLRLIPSVPEESLYPLLYASSKPVQEAAYKLLSQNIRSGVENLSVEAALDKKTVCLPHALLSSILEAPAIARLNEEGKSDMQTYLSSWRLIFEHMKGASFKVQTDYADQIKDGQFLAGLLALIYAGLGLSKGKPADLSSRNLADYVQSDEQDQKYLLGHLYFLCLKYLPSLVKLNMLELKSRHLPAVIEAWTAKHISPELINDSLTEVARWAKLTVDEDPEYEKMQVTVGMKSKEINVRYVVDEQTMAIKIVLPDAYPLASAQVIGVNRVAVKEDKWQSWLRNCQGVITFSNGSITDGLSVWRRNVTGALKGQTECAICYSIISAERQLPSKKCPTCKNLFHSGCLFKWFKTSNASTCPLCRNPFNFS